MAQAGADFVAPWSPQCAFNLLFEISRYHRRKDVSTLRFWTRCLRFFCCLLFLLGKLTWRVRRFLRYVLFLFGREIAVNPALKFLDCARICLLCNRAREQQNGEKAQC